MNIGNKLETNNEDEIFHEVIKSENYKTFDGWLERENEIRRLVAIVEHSNDAIIGIDLECVIISWNRGAEKIYGYTKDEAIGCSLSILAPPEKEEEVKINIERTIKGEEVYEFETMRTNKLGETVHVLKTMSIVKDNNDNIVGVSIIARDVTERKKKEEELREIYKKIECLKKETESANKVKSQFLANMSHEIRTPINGIMCSADLLSSTELSELQQEYINMLKISSESLLQIINDILDISKIESGKLKLSKESFNLRDNIEKIIKEFWIISQNKGIELMYFIEPFVSLELIGDPIKLNQVLINLISNSIKFTEKGHIFIRVSKMKTKSNSLTLLFSVEDTGIGMSEEVKNKLFKKNSLITLHKSVSFIILSSIRILPSIITLISISVLMIYSDLE
jgi:PAS domain S-box-containing protein